MITLSAALLAWHSVSQVVFSSRDTTTLTVMSGMLYERKGQVYNIDDRSGDISSKTNTWPISNTEC